MKCCNDAATKNNHKMKALNANNQKTLEALQSKANGSGRFPSIKRIANLLEELNIDFEMRSTMVQKQRFSEQNNFATSTGKVVEGFKIKFKQINGNFMVIDNTCSHFSKNTWTFANNLIDVIETL